MIKIENVEVLGWEHAIRGMRNPMNSWEKSDSEFVSKYSKGVGIDLNNDGFEDFVFIIPHGFLPPVSV